jgi:tetratricopeptide (TPR) repeat protein
LCVVLDEFHWADGQSVALVRHVARTVEPGSLVVLVTYRDSDLNKDHPSTGALADLRRLQGVERIALTGLGADEVAELLSAGAGHDLDQKGLVLAGELATETGGNPFFLGEILRSLIESGALTFDPITGRWSVDLSTVSSMPDSVRDVIERRIDRLGENAREMLTMAAVIGRSFDLRLLKELVEISEGPLLDELEGAVGATLLRESTDHIGRFTFEHALINHTFYQGLGATRRSRLHHRVAQALEALYGTDSDEMLGDLALHWRLATVAVDTTKAAGYSIRAGRRALDSLAPSEAVRLFGDALELLGPGEAVARCDALLGLGEAQRLTGNAAYRETLLDASRIASELRDGSRAARAALANNRGQTSVYGQVDSERVAVIERALEPDDDPDRRARLLSLQGRELLYDRDDHHHRNALAEQALALAREVGNPRTIAHVLDDYFHLLFPPYGLGRRLAHLDERAAAVRAAGDPALEFWTANVEFNTMAAAGDLERAESARRMAAIAKRLGEPTMRWQAAFNAGACMSMLRGDLTELERCAEQGLEIGSEAGEPDAFMIYGGQLVLLRVIQGRAGEVVELLVQGVKANPLISAWKATLAWTWCWLDRRDEAATIVTEAAVDRFEHLPWEPSRLSALAAYADAAAQASVTDAVEILYELIEPWADQVVWNGATTYGHASIYLGLLAAALGRHEQADGHFAHAVELQQRDGMLVWAARAHLGWAEALAPRGDIEGAREHAEQALALANAHGYGFIGPRAAAIIAATAPVS